MTISTLRQRGFTLIELLVVIAIIAILASVVLASLNTAREKGANAAIQSSLNNARAQAELFYDDNSNEYTNVCTAAGGIGQFEVGAENAGATVECASSATEWAMQAQLVGTGAGYYCVDSTGNSTTTGGDTINGGGADYTCG